MQKRAYSKPRAKYALNDLIDHRSAKLGTTRGVIISDLSERCDVSRSQIFRYAWYIVGDVGSIPSDKMRIIADYFLVPVDAIFNR